MLKSQNSSKGGQRFTNPFSLSLSTYCTVKVKALRNTNIKQFNLVSIEMRYDISERINFPVFTDFFHPVIQAREEILIGTIYNYCTRSSNWCNLLTKHCSNTKP